MDDKYIQLLKWGREKPEGVSYRDLTDKLKELGFPNSGEYKAGTINHFTDPIFSAMTPNYILNYEGYFQLLEYERLEEARKESNKAVKLATWSFWLAIFFSLASIVIGILQIR